LLTPRPPPLELVACLGVGFASGVVERGFKLNENALAFTPVPKDMGAGVSPGAASACFVEAAGLLLPLVPACLLSMIYVSTSMPASFKTRITSTHSSSLSYKTNSDTRTDSRRTMRSAIWDFCFVSSRHKEKNFALMPSNLCCMDWSSRA
jgi:hypothetical protein